MVGHPEDLTGSMKLRSYMRSHCMLHIWSKKLAKLGAWRKAIMTSPQKEMTTKPDAFDWADPLMIDQQITEEERLVQSSARSFAQDRLMTRVRDDFRQESFDGSIFREMGELGLLGSTLPSEYGGAELGYVSYGLISREIERVCLWQRCTAQKIFAKAHLRYPDWVFWTD
jgi:hypothetical protein